jgi:hypothetical protein
MRARHLGGSIASVCPSITVNPRERNRRRMGERLPDLGEETGELIQGPWTGRKFFRDRSNHGALGLLVISEALCISQFRNIAVISARESYHSAHPAALFMRPSAIVPSDSCGMTGSCLVPHTGPDLCEPDLTGSGLCARRPSHLGTREPEMSVPTRSGTARP